MKRILLCSKNKKVKEPSMHFFVSRYILLWDICRKMISLLLDINGEGIKWVLTGRCDDEEDTVEQQTTKR